MKKSLLVTLLVAAVVLGAGALFALSGTSVDTTADATTTSTVEGSWMSAGFPLDTALTTNLKGVRDDCPRLNVYCLDVYDPVYCSSDGQTYSNSCYAYRACATGCTGGV